MSGIFISYSSKDADVVSRLREALVNQGIEEPWQDFRQLKGKDSLEAEIYQAIDKSSYFIVIVSPNIFESEWVKKETRLAMKIQIKRNAEPLISRLISLVIPKFGKKKFKIIPLILDDTPLNALQWIFPKQPAAIRISTAPGGISQAMPEIFAALDFIQNPM
jgi:hypothetical protein